MIDVAFGGDGASKPLPLVPGHITRNIGTQDIRLVRDWIPMQTNRSSEDRKLWIYQYQNGEDKVWNSFFAFSDAVEFLPADYHIMNCYTGGSAESFQTYTVLVVQFLRREDQDGSGEAGVYGKRMLAGGVVKENLGGKTQVVQVCENEKERVEALKKWFGIELTEEEKEGIKGWKTELRTVADAG
jgi:arylamine N-acetyltransferase